MKDSDYNVIYENATTIRPRKRIKKPRQSKEEEKNIFFRCFQWIIIVNSRSTSNIQQRSFTRSHRNL